MVTSEQLEKLKEPMPYKWRVQSTKFGKSTVVAYVDARQVQDKLDEVLGGANWQNDFKLIDGKLFGGVGVNTEDGWIWKWDTGVESNMDAEKGQVSDAFKRAAVHFGVGRFLYSLGIVTLNAKEHTNKKEYPATREGKILWNSEELNAYVSKIVAEGILDDTKPVKPTQVAKQTKSTKTNETTPKKETSKLVSDNGELSPNTSFDDSKPAVGKTSSLSERQQKAIKFFSQYNEPDVIKFLIKEKKMMFASIKDFVEKTPIEEALAIASEWKELQDKK